MKRLLFLFLWVSLCNAEQQQAALPLPDSLRALTFNINNTNSQRFSTSGVYPAASDAVTSVSLSSLHKIWENPHYLVLSCTLAAGGALLVHWLLLRNALNNSDNWSQWKLELSLSTLRSSLTADLARDLFTAIKERYVQHHQATGLLDPIVCFINDVDKEKAQLESLCSLRSWLKKVPLVARFVAESPCEQEKLERLNLLKKLLITWLSEYKVEHA